MRLLVLCLLAATVTTAQAQRVSKVGAKTLMTACSGGKQAELCDAYLDGFTDAIRANGQASALACIPQSVTGTELRDVDRPLAARQSGITARDRREGHPPGVAEGLSLPQVTRRRITSGSRLRAATSATPAPSPTANGSSSAVPPASTTRP